MSPNKMEYEGKLYGKVGGKYFPMKETTKDIDVLREKAKELDALYGINKFIDDIFGFK